MALRRTVVRLSGTTHLGVRLPLARSVGVAASRGPDAGVRRRAWGCFLQLNATAGGGARLSGNFWMSSAVAFAAR
jgi:hypothetical protein